MFKHAAYYDASFDQAKFDKEMLATKDQDGLMAKEDKVKLDNLAGAAPITKEDLELGNVTNDAQVKRSEMGTANGVATLDDAGLIPSAQLPGFVDDILEFETVDAFPAEGESGKLYVDIDANMSYRWTGTQYIPIPNGGLALGETSATAFAGDKGKAVTEAVDAIVNGTTIVPKAVDAKTVNGFAVGATVPATAKFTDTVYEHPETHEASMIVESEEKKFATKAQLDKVDSIPEDAVYTDTVYEHPETHEASMIVETEDRKFMTPAQVEKLATLPNFSNTPYYDETKGIFYACGIPVILTASETTGMNKASWYKKDGDNAQKSIEFPVGGNVYGGGDGDIDNSITFYPSTCITVESGTYKNIFGGSDGRGSVGFASIVVNGGTINGIQGGGRSSTSTSGYENIVGAVEVIINNTDNQLQVIYGGPQGYGVVGKSKIIMNGGSAQWVTAAGSHGHTSIAEIEINDGEMIVLQGCNRGTVNNIKMTVNGGTIQRVYAGGETEDTSVTATFAKAELHVNGGTFNSVSTGSNGGVASTVGVSGDYKAGIITDEVATAMGLVKAPMVITDITFEDGNLVIKNGEEVIKTITIA